MAFSILWFGATGATILMTMVSPLMGARTALGWQVFLFPFANVYIAGGCMFVTAAIFFFGKFVHRVRLPLNVMLVALWLGWAAMVLLSANLATQRQLLQFIEFGVYGLLAILLFSVLGEDEAASEELIRRMLWSSLALSCVFIAAALTTSEWPARLIGRNEGMFVVMAYGGPAAARAAWRGGRRVAFLVATLTVLAAVLSTSRAALTMAATCLAFAAFHAMARRFRTLPAIVGAGLVLALLTIAFLPTAGQWFSASVPIRVDEGSHSDRERWNLIIESVHLFEERPVLGWGWGRIDELIPRIRTVQGTYPHPHNTYASFAVQLGAAGLIFLLVLYGYVFFVAWQAWRHGCDSAFMFSGVVGVLLVGFSMTEAVFYGASRAIVAIVLIAVSLSLVHQMVDRAAAEPRAIGPA